jgi:urease accessory protein UreE
MRLVEERFLAHHLQLADALIAANQMLGDMLLGLGAKVEELEAPFEPESGTYGGGHQYQEDGGHGGRIHQYGK